MKELKFSLIIVGYIISLLCIKNHIFIVLNVILLIYLIIKKKPYKYYLYGVLILFFRLIIIDNNYEFNNIDKYLVILNKENYVILINNKLQQFVSYDLLDANMFSVLQIEGNYKELIKSSNFDLFSFKDYLSYRNIEYELEVNNYQILSNGDTFKPKLMEHLLKGLDIKSSSIINMLIFGNKDDKELYNKLINLGVVQLFVVSGFHFNALEQVLVKIKVKWINILILVFFAFYLYILDFQIAASRAFLMFCLKLLVDKVKFLNNFMNYLLVLSLFLLINPYYIYHQGFILSFLLTFILIFIKEIKIKKLYKSFIVYLCALPIIISMNNEINILSFLFQLILTPLVTLLFFSSWLTLLVKFLSPLYLILVNIFILLVDIFNSVPSMVIIKSLSFFELFLYFSLILIIIYLLAIKLNKKIGIFACLLSILLIYQYNYCFIFEKESVVFFDVGQGDCTLINLGNNKGHILIDTGGNINYDYATKVIIPYLKANGIRKLDYVLISHNDYDHNGSLESLINNYNVNKVLYGSDFKELEYERFKITNLNYGTNYNGDNERSGVFYFELFSKSFLIMGDASKKNEEEIMYRYSLDIDYLRIGHHGSNTSSSLMFLDNISCNNAIISVGKYNKYGHPHKEVLDSLNMLNYNIYRTDLHGMIIITSNGIKTRFDV